MAIEKAKVLSALQLKFKGKSLTKTFLDKTATRYAAKIENDADMDDYINDREEDIVAASEEADRRITAHTKKLEDPKKNDRKEEPEIDEDELKDAPPYVRAMMKSLEGMKTEITGLKAEKTQSTLQQRFLSDERLKGIDPKLLKGRFPTKEEDFETAITEAAEELKEYVKADQSDAADNKQQGLQTKIGVGGFGDKPVHTNIKPATAAADKSKQVPPEIKEFTEKLNKANAVSQAK
jgi:hypothetical protein